MASLREMFFREHDSLATHLDLTVDLQGVSSTVIERAVFGLESGVNYLSYYFPPGSYSTELADVILLNYENAKVRTTEGQEISGQHVAVLTQSPIYGRQPFSPQVQFYIDQSLSRSEIARLEEFATQQGLIIRVKERSYSEWVTEHETPWGFISHDSRDKDSLARPLADKLATMMCPVWYDEYSLSVGDSLRESIDAGLQQAPKCIILLSANYLRNDGWTRNEFNAAFGRHARSGGGVLLPVWHGVSAADVGNYSPMLLDLFALNTRSGMDEIAQRLFVALKPS